MGLGVIPFQPWIKLGPGGIPWNRAELRGSDLSMKSIPRIGMSAEERLTVGPTNRISFADERMPAVLATPWLVAHLEYAARAAIASCLTDDEPKRRDLRRGRAPRAGSRRR